MSSKNKVVYGLYQNRGSLESGVSALKTQGFRNTDISVLFPDSESNKEFSHTKETKAPEGAAMGAGTGATIGGALGWLAGIGTLAIPAVGPLIAAGPIIALLAGIGIGGAVGGLAGGLIGMGFPEYEAKRFEGLIKNGGILLSVHCDDSDWIKKASDILKHTGAEHISSVSEAKAAVKVDEHNRIVSEVA